MALLFMDGFATYDIATKWDAGSTTSGGTNTTTPRVTGGSWIVLYNTGLLKSFTASSKVIVGNGVYCNTGNSNCIVFYGDAGATVHIAVYRNTSGYIEIRRGGVGGTLLATGTTNIPLTTWFYMEASVTISDTVGEVHVRLNGSGTDEVSYTGDTKNSGTANTIDKIQIATVTGGANVWYTDIYILNDTGSAPNNAFLGDVTVRTLSPTGNGNSSQLVGSDGNSIDNYLLVDEKPFSGTDYVGSPTTGQKDSYALADLPASTTNVFGVQINVNMTKSDAGLGQSRVIVRVGGTDYGGTTRVLSTGNVTYHELYEQNPNTSAQWTAANVNGLEAGMEVM